METGCLKFWHNSKWIIFSKFHQTNITLWPNRLFNDDFGRLLGTEPLFRGIRVAVIYPFFIICFNSPDKSIIHGITDKLTTAIYSTLNLLRYQLMRYRSTATVWFYNVLIWRYMVYFDASSSSDSIRVLFSWFSSKTLEYILNIA